MTARPLHIAPSGSYGRLAVMVIVGFLILRVIALILSPLNLHGDEAQYWTWAQDLDWGYFSKPPMIAWIIAFTTALFGDAEWAVRLASPFIHSATAFLLYLIGKTLFDGRTGFYASLIYLTIPALWLSSGIISTDVPLLLFWAAALLAWTKWRELDLAQRHSAAFKGTSMKWAMIFGLSFGLGCLSKYAMLFMVPGLILLIILDTKTRQAWLSFYGVLAVAVALLTLAPNLYWNLQNDFATLTHTAANANLSGFVFHADELLSFWGAQFGVFGPLSLILLIIGLVYAAKKRGKLTPQSAVFCLIIFTLFPLLIISVEALLSRANANWAVSAYISATLLLAHWGQTLFTKWIKPVIGINIALGLLIMSAGLLPSFANKVGQANAFKRMRAWPQTAQAIKAEFDKGHDGQSFRAVAVDNRIVFYDLVFYADESLPNLSMWLNTTQAANHAELTRPLLGQSQLTPEQARLNHPILLVNHYQDYDEKFREDFKRLIPLGSIKTDLGGGKVRTLNLWAGYGYSPTTTRTS